MKGKNVSLIRAILANGICNTTTLTVANSVDVWVSESYSMTVYKLS